VSCPYNARDSPGFCPHRWRGISSRQIASAVAQAFQPVAYGTHRRDAEVAERTNAEAGEAPCRPYGRQVVTQ